MRTFHVLACLVLVGAPAGAAQATRFGYCYVDFGAGAEATRYLSGVVDTAGQAGVLAAGGSFREAFLDHVRSRYESAAAAAACDAWETANDANRAAFELPTASDLIRVRTGWLGGMREANASKVAKPAKSGAPTAATKPAKPETPVAAVKPPAPSSPPPKPKWEVEYEAKKAVYDRELARQQAAVAEYEVAKAAHAKRQAEAAAQAAKERAEWERAVAACKAGDYSACAHPPRQ